MKTGGCRMRGCLLYKWGRSADQLLLITMNPCEGVLFGRPQSRDRASNLSFPAVIIPTHESVGNWAPLDTASEEPLAVGSALFFTALCWSSSHFPLHWINPSRALEKAFQSDSVCLGLKSLCLQIEVAPSTITLLSISGPC